MLKHRPIGLLVSLAASAGLVATLASPAAATSCVPIEAQLTDLQAGSVVFVGTIVARDATTVQVRVDQWFSGADPRDQLAIPMPRPGGPITAGSWEPSVGERWFIIGDRLDPGTVDSGICRQMPYDPSLAAAAMAAFGPPQSPPFGERVPEDAGGPPLALAAGLVAVGVLIGLGGVLYVQRRARASVA